MVSSPTSVRTTAAVSEMALDDAGKQAWRRRIPFRAMLVGENVLVVFEVFADFFQGGIFSNAVSDGPYVL